MSVVSRQLSVVSGQSSVVSCQLSVAPECNGHRTTDNGPPSSTFPLPPSPFRLGISLTEVLIAMGILTIGLLSVAAIFPVGSFMVHKAEVADRGSAIAQSVMNDIVARGMLDPRSWFVMVPWNNVPPPANVIFPSDGKYAPIPQPPSLNSMAATFARPFALTLSEALNQPTASTDPTLIERQFGSAYVIDPIGMAALTFANGQVPPPNAHGPASTFPAAGYQAWYYYAQWPNWPSSIWSPWSGGNKLSGGHGFLWPVRRVTFRQLSTGWQMDKTMAEHYFRGNDDLAVDFPKRDDRPAMQNWDVDKNTQAPLARQWVGDYSWIVTVVPATNAARDAMARNPEGHAYNVSVVVFYKRVLPDDALTSWVDLGTKGIDYYNAMSENERAVRASIVSTGLNGGELLLTDFGENSSKSAFDGLKTGQWIMLCGPHPNSNVNRATNPPTGESRLVLNWYQVLSIEGKEKRLNANGTDDPAPPATDPERRVVALRGPQWPWVPGGNASENLCVAICRGAVAVHTKTIRLEGPRAGVGAFGNGGNPAETQKDYSFP